MSLQNMSLSVEKIQEILQEPGKKQQINRACRLEERVRFHTEVNLTDTHVAGASTNFLAWVKKLLPDDKYKVFNTLYQFPLATTSIVEDVYFELSRVFDSRNASNIYQFKDQTETKNWAKYRLDKLESDTIWKVTGWDKMKTSFNSILIVDLPAEQEEELPEPYFYWLDIDKVIDYELDSDGSRLKWIVFKQDDSKLAVFDEVSNRVFQCDDSYTELQSQLIDSPHNLGYCPARFFWTDTVSKKEQDLRKNPITKELSNLDWLLFFSISKRHLDLYAPYPIYSAYETSCDFKNAVGDYCDHGYMRLNTGEYNILRDGSVEECPICKNKHLTGPGTLLEVPIPDKETGDMRNPVQITTIDESSLKYNTKETERLELLIKSRIIGQQQDQASNREAVNELQVRAHFESKTSVLNKLKINFEMAQTFVEETICRLRYGESFIELSISYGSEFYVYTIQELYTKYAEAKKAGVMNAELDLLQDQILEMEHKNNSLTLQRILILKQVEPLRHYTLDEVLRLKESGLVSGLDVLVKVNFDSLIDRFERENINVIDFGKNSEKITIDDKINKIKTKIYEYAEEQWKELRRQQSVNQEAKESKED